MQKRLLFILVCAAFALTGCLKPYTPSVQQGNILTQADVNQLKIGMSKDDVQYLLGAPILQATISSNEWDYIYTYQPIDNGTVKEKHVALFFNDQDKLVKIDANLTPQQLNIAKPIKF